MFHVVHSFKSVYVPHLALLGEGGLGYELAVLQGVQPAVHPLLHVVLGGTVVTGQEDRRTGGQGTGQDKNWIWRTGHLEEFDELGPGLVPGLALARPGLGGGRWRQMMRKKRRRVRRKREIRRRKMRGRRRGRRRTKKRR